jgi:5-methylcytosine-specific restriction endonuclease McrA
MAEVISHAPNGCPALVLNADFRPLSYYPLSLWPWQEVVKAVFLERVDVVAEYDQYVHSPSFRMRLPSVIALREFVRQDRPPAFTRFNVFLRDGFKCAYCGSTEDLTFDHVVPRSRGGRTSWENIVAACSPCNLRKGGRRPADAHMHLHARPHPPSAFQLQEMGRRFPPHYMHQTWLDYLYWDVELEG